MRILFYPKYRLTPTTTIPYYGLIFFLLGSAKDTEAAAAAGPRQQQPTNAYLKQCSICKKNRYK